MTWAKATNIATGEVHWDSTPDALDPQAYTIELIAGEPIEPLQEELARAVEGRMASVFLRGFTVPTGPLAGKTLQVRNDTDRTNWLTSKDIYRDEIAAGNGDVADQAEIRTAENETVKCTFSEGFDVLQAMAVWGRNIMRNSWTLKDAIRAASTLSDLSAVDVGAGWP